VPRKFSNSLSPAFAWPAYQRSEPPRSRDAEGLSRVGTGHLPFASPPQREQTSRSRQSSTDVSAPYQVAISAGSGSTWCRHSLHQGGSVNYTGEGR
jgi:hypothetical protein